MTGRTRFAVSVALLLSVTVAVGVATPTVTSAAPATPVSVVSGATYTSVSCTSQVYDSVATVMDVHVDGTDVYIGGCFLDWNGIAAADYIVKWNGSSWSALGSDSGGDGFLDGPVFAIDKAGTDIVVGGKFSYERTGGSSYGIVTWTGAAWDATIGTASCGGNNYYRLGSLDEVHDIAVDGSSTYITGKIGGGFRCVGGMPNNSFTYSDVAKWDGSELGVLTPTWDNNTWPTEVEVLSSGDVYVGVGYKCGAFCTWSAARKNKLLWKYSSSTWSAVTWDVVAPSGPLVSGPPDRMGIFELAKDASGNLLVGGYFEDAGGIATADYVAKYDGSAWSSLGVVPFDGYGNPGVTSITRVGSVHYFGGTFAGRPLWSWTAASSTFRPVGSFGLGELTKHLTVVASGSTLYLGGSFTTLDGVSGASRLAKVAVGSSSAGAALSLAGGTPLSPGFSAGTTSYTASVPEGTCTETVSFDAADGSASVTYTVDGGATKLWPASGGVSVTLKKGTGITLAVTVRAADVSSSTTYSLVVTRQGTATNPGASTGSESVEVTSATVPVTITPNGHAVSSTLRWGTSTGVYTASASAPYVACDAAPTSADVTMNGLSASTTYYYVVEVTRSVDSAVVTSAEKSFTTEPGAYVAVSSVSSITVSSATLNLNLNALGTWDNYQVHLSADLSYGTCLLPPRWFGDSQCIKTFANQGTSNPETTSVTASGLSAATTYNYRVRVPDCCGGAKRTVTGTFTTSAAPASSVVPASSVPSSTTVTTTAPTQSTVVTQSTVATGSSTTATTLPSLKIGKTASRATLLSFAKLSAPSGSRYAVKASPTTVCKVLGLGVKGVKKGTCRVTVTVTPKGKKATSKTVSLAVS